MDTKGTPDDPLKAYFEQMRQLPLRLDAHLQNVSQAVHQAVQSAQQRAVQAYVNPARFGSLVDSGVQALADNTAERLAEFERSLRESIAPAMERIQQSFHDLPPRIQTALRELGDHGWYLDEDMPLDAIWGLEETMGAGRTADAEKALCVYFEENLGAIEASIVAGFPHRAHLTRAAFTAHRRGEYALSIPVFFTQTDGICKDVTNEYLFMKARGEGQAGRPGTAIYVSSITADTVLSAMMSPLAETLPISMSKHERPDGFDGLNRHMVLHGESLDYDTRENSLKAISLIGYVGRVLPLSDEKSI